MKSKLFNGLLGALAFAVAPQLMAKSYSSADSTTSSTTTSSDSMGMPNDSTTASNTQVTNTEVVNHYYDDSDWTKNFTLSLGLDGLYSNASVKHDANGYSAKSNPAFGYGAMAAVELGLADFAGIALGAHFLERKFEVKNDALNAYKFTRTIPTVFIPLEGRFYFFKLLSIGAGGFASLPVGNASDKYSTGGNTAVTTESKQQRAVDFGLTAAVGVNVPIGESLGIFGEARYNYGLTDSAQNSDLEQRIRDFMMTVGVKLKI